MKDKGETEADVYLELRIQEKKKGKRNSISKQRDWDTGKGFLHPVKRWIPMWAGRLWAVLAHARLSWSRNPHFIPSKEFFFFIPKGS